MPKQTTSQKDLDGRPASSPTAYRRTIDYADKNVLAELDWAPLPHINNGEDCSWSDAREYTRVEPRVTRGISVMQ